MTTKYDIKATFDTPDGEPIPATIVKRSLASPAIDKSVLYIDDIGVAMPDSVKVENGITLVLKIKPSV